MIKFGIVLWLEVKRASVRNDVISVYKTKFGVILNIVDLAKQICSFYGYKIHVYEYECG